MSTTLTKRPYTRALSEAEAFRELFPLTTYCQWAIAGSVRRRRKEVGDVEHVVQAVAGEVEIGGGLFAERKVVNLLWWRLEELLKAGTVAQHLYPTANGGLTTRWGEKYRGVDFGCCNQEIFLADHHNWGAILAIRTGPAELSRELVTRLQRQGYMQVGGYVRNKRDWSCRCGWRGAETAYADLDELAASCEGRKILYRRGNGDGAVDICPVCRQPDVEPALVSVPTEEEYFALAGMAYLRPEDR